MSIQFRRGQKVWRRDDPSRVYVVAGQSGDAVDVSIVDGVYRRYTTINAADLALADERASSSDGGQRPDGGQRKD